MDAEAHRRRQVFELLLCEAIVKLGLEPGESFEAAASIGPFHAKLVIEGDPQSILPMAGAVDLREGRRTECERDILMLLLMEHPARLTTDEIFETLLASPHPHGLSTVKAALSRLRKVHKLLVNELGRTGYGLTDAGLAESRRLGAA